MTLTEKIKSYSEFYHRIVNDPEYATKTSMPGNSYFLENDEILTIPRDDGDCRYPYSSDGFIFWAYSSGYMHSNEGIFSPFLYAGEGKEPKIAFFASVPIKGAKEAVSLLPVPLLKSTVTVDRYSIFTKSSVTYVAELPEWRFAVRVFISHEKEIFFTVSIENLSEKSAEITLSAFFNPFLLHAITEDSENKWFREVKYCEVQDSSQLGSFLIKTNEDISRTVSASNYGVIRRNILCGEGSQMVAHEETASRNQYVGGSRGSLHMPAALDRNTFGEANHVCTFTEWGAAGDLLRLSLNGESTVRYDILFHYEAYCKDEDKIRELLGDKIKPGQVDRILSDLEDSETKKSSLLTCKVFDSAEPHLKAQVFNGFFEHLKKQVEFCSLIKGYVQISAGSLIGIRDIFQAVEGLTLWQPESARRKMLEALNFISPDGRCPRQYTLPSDEGQMPVMDLRAFIDQGVWVISTIITYLKYTGEEAFLYEDCGYYEITDIKQKLVKKSMIHNSVLEHMFRIMDYLLFNRDEKTKCVRALYGDWNDALDGLGVSSDPGKEFGTGVSVMTSLQVYQSLDEMTELLDRLDREKYSPYIEKYQKARTELREGLKKYALIEDAEGRKKIVHGWGDNLSYYVGSFDDPDHQSRDGLTSNAFWVLSGLYEDDRSIKNTILSAFHRLDSKYGLKTFEPCFEPNTKRVGRIPKLPAGTAENGAAYIHATLFGVAALFRMGCSEFAWQQLIKVLPFTHVYLSCSPYVMPNSYGYNPEKNIDGESMQDWQTGSSNVLFKLIVKYVFGISPEFDGLWIQPAVYNPFKSCKLKIRIRGCDVKIICSQRQAEEREFFVNDEKRTPVFDETMNLQKLWIPYQDLTCPNMEIIVIL